MLAKAQISIEMTIVAAAVLILTGIVVANFFDVKDETVALAIVKNAAIEKIEGADEKIVVSGIEHQEKDSGIQIVINAEPEGVAEKYFDEAWKEGLAKKIVGKTNYRAVEVKINGNN